MENGRMIMVEMEKANRRYENDENAE